jgi:hypothetical protein
MLRPIGSLPPTVYWRRRLLLLAPVVLIAITAYVVVNSGGSSKKAAGSTGAGAAASSSHSAAAQSTGASPSAGASSPATSPSKSSSPPASPSTVKSSAKTTVTAAPVACLPSSLSVTAATGAPSYAVGATPTLYLQVTNVGKSPCIENLSDREIEMRVYNGASRVWGSHDCQIAPDTPAVTLAVNQPVRRSVVWTGLSSQPACAGTRQRVGAGTYTLQVYLAGVAGKTAAFALK